MYRIRNASLNDGEAIQTIAKKSWEFTYEKIFTQTFIDDFISKAYDPNHMPQYIKQMDEGNGGFFVAEDDGAMIGFAQIGFDWDFKGEYRLSRIYLLPEYIGKGIGLDLLSRCEEFVKSQNSDQYGLYVHKDNIIGKKFYLKNGFKHVPDRDDEDELYFQKKL